MKSYRKSYRNVLAFTCFGCDAECHVAEHIASGEQMLTHPDPPCDAFMKDRPLDEFLRECRLKKHSN